MRQLPKWTLLLALASIADAQAIQRPDVPAAIKAPAAERVVLKAHASGFQIYTCTHSSDGNLQWTLKGPDAQLRDSKGAVIGRHFAGPTWKHRDGSEVAGKATAHADSPNARSIPWLLVTATTHSGVGILTSVTSVQRVNTKGGQPPPAEQCTDAKLNEEARSRYTADYYFFGPP